ncbi:MAG: TonB family protein [bacterium]
MSRHDSARVPWAFSLADAPQLPVTGEMHPLRRETAKWLSWANAVSLVLGLLAFAAWLAWTHARETAPVARRVHIVRYTELGVPPSIARPAVPQLAIAQAVAPPSIGIPEPVKDELAPAKTVATVKEMAEALAPITTTDLGGSGAGDTLVVENDTQGSPSPDDFVAVDEDPVRLRIDPPVYPELAKSAGVQGTVMVRVLVGKDGKVKNVIVVEGNPLLNEAAIASAKSAVFRPAISQQQPVEVWVMMPITFKLSG